MKKISTTDKATRAPKAGPIIGARIVTMDKGGSSTPGLAYKGDLPEVGATIRATLDNAVTYSGVVADAIETGGGVLVEFKNGLTPLT